MTSAEIRQTYIDFFVKKHGHTFVASSSVVPHDDPTLLFTNAGMNQFKPYFLGTEKAPWKRVANTQKCIRAGGKHNDLDDVGRSRRHHTFFEMLGNWSFGDYFKRGAIEMSWELVTKVFKVDPERIHVTCYEGDEKNKIPRDTEAAQLWKEIAGLPDDHIHYLGKENFWEMGETGPCGPCTEIFIDRTPGKTGGPSVVKDDDPRVMEFWNNVFIQYNRDANGVLTPLPAQHVDTGMGFERICQILQNKDDNYAIDLWEPFFRKISELSGKKYAGKFPKTNVADPAAEAADEQLRTDIAFRVIADHARCLTFALTDGAVPSNEGRGYVLRRILRRAVRFGRQQLGLTEPFMHQLVDVVVAEMGGAFPELKKNPGRLVELVKDEEVGFGRTLDRGIELFEFAVAREAANEYATREGLIVNSVGRAQGSATWLLSFNERDRGERTEMTLERVQLELQTASKRSSRLGAEDAFKLHDTYGFPIDLTRIMAEERGMSVDIAGYEKLMEEAREKARAGGKAEQSAVYDLNPAAISQLQADHAKPTDDSAKYGVEPIQANVIGIWNGTNFGKSIDVSADQEVAIILDRTNFYAEMGGQVGDKGTLFLSPSPGNPGEGGGEGSSLPGGTKDPHPNPLPEYRARGRENVFDVETTRAVGGYVLHIGRMRSGKIEKNQNVTVSLAPSRQMTMQNHTATHLANWALREVLGEGVQQKGSLVDAEKLRFDFSHGKGMSDEEIERVEKLVNEAVGKKLAVYAEVVPQEKALKIEGLRAVFGEKYPAMVRVVSVGAPVAELIANPSDAKWRQFSVEFCGGTHLGNSAEVKQFVITAEESVSKGVRRLVAPTGDAAAVAGSKAAELEKAIARIGALPEAELPQAIAGLQKEAGGEGVPLRAKRKAQQAVGELQAKFKMWEKSQRASSSGGNSEVLAAADRLLQSAVELGGGKLVIGEIPSASDEQLRVAMDSLKKKAGSYGILLGSAGEGKVTFVAAVSDDLVGKGLKAGDLVREAAQVAGGKGGGRPQMAQGGGKDAAKLGEALKVARKFAVGVVK